MYKKNIFESSSVLPSLTQKIPSDRTGVNGTERIGDRSDVGATPLANNYKIWGNLDKQSRGMTGLLDTQGHGGPTLFTDHRNSAGQAITGTKTPEAYKKMLKESASGKSSTGVSSGKNKISGVSDSIKDKYINGGDTTVSKEFEHKKPLTESQIIGSMLVIRALNSFK